MDLVHRRRPIGAAVFLTVALLGFTSCGGGEESSGAGTGDEKAISPVESGAEDLAKCLTDAGLTASLSTSRALGVDAEHRIVKIDGLDPTTAVFEQAQGADLYVLADAAAAEENLTALTLKTEQDDQVWITGRIVVRFDYRAVRGAPEVQQIQTCVDAVSAE